MAINRRNITRGFQGSNPDSYAELLRKTRERHGISLDEVSKDLHVREDILQAIESGDFSKIPPQGYSRNMIKSYARLLGLDANKVTEMFLDAEYSFQIGKKRKSAQDITDENKKRVPKAPVISTHKGFKTPRQQIEEAKRRKKDSATTDTVLTAGSIPPRTMHVYGKKYKNTPRARKDQDIAEAPTYKMPEYVSKASTSNDLLNGDNYNSARERLASRQRKNMSRRHKISRNDSYTLSEKENPNSLGQEQTRKLNYGFMGSFYGTNRGGNSAAQNRMLVPIVAGAVVVLIILLILIFFFVGKANENDRTDVSKLNVVGISDVENPNTNEEGSEEEAQAVPKEVEFKYKVKDGMTVYMEIYEGANTRPTLARELKPGETNSFKVTDTLKVVTSRPDGVELYVGDELVQPKDEKGKGVYTYTVDFNSWLTA